MNILKNRFLGEKFDFWSKIWFFHQILNWATEAIFRRRKTYDTALQRFKSTISIYVHPKVCAHTRHMKHVTKFQKKNEILDFACAWCVHRMCLMCAHTWGCSQIESMDLKLSNVVSHVFLRQKLASVAPIKIWWENQIFDQKSNFSSKNRFFKILTKSRFEPQGWVFELWNSYGAHSKALGPL